MRSRLALCVVMISAVVAAAAVAASSAQSGGAPAPAPASQADVPTWSKDVAPIVQKNCQVCHRPGEAGPFSLLTYQDARRRAAKIKDAVADRVMPPWFADPHYGKFSNAMGLSASEIDTIVKWVDGGAPEGDPRDLPKPAEWVEGWGIGKPDMVFELPQPFDVPARGVVEYQHVIVPTGFTEDRWIQAAEVRPTERSVVHHLIAFVREPKSNWFRGQPAGVFFTAPKVSTDEETEVGALPSDFLVGYAPGQPAEILEPGQGKLIKAGSDIVFQMHYTPHGHARSDRTRLGIVFAKAAAERARPHALGGQRHVQDSAGPSELSRRRELRSGHGRQARQPASAHARTRKGLRVPRGVSVGQDGHPAPSAPLLLALAELVQPRATARAAEGHANRLHRALRQLTEQPGGRRSDEGSDVGRPELGRDDDRVLQPGVRRQASG